MDDSPRSSKRRKLDTPERKTPATRRKAATRLSSRKVLNVEDQDGVDEQDAVTPSRRSGRKFAAASASIINGTPRKGASEQERELYDDIEGALPKMGEPVMLSRPQSPAPKPTTPPKWKGKKIVYDPATMPHPFKRSPAKPPPAKPSVQETTTNTESSSYRSFRTLVNGYRHERDEAAQDEITLATTSTKGVRSARMAKAKATTSVKKTATPTNQRARRTPRRPYESEEDVGSADPIQPASDGKAPSKARSGRRTRTTTKAEIDTVEESEEDELAVPTPSKSSKRHAPVSDSEDELGDRTPPRSAKKARGRRIYNRTDHIENRQEEPAAVPESNAEQEEDVVASELHGHDSDEEDSLSFDGNSVTGSVLDPTEPSPFNQPTPAGKKKTVAALIQGRLQSGPALDLLKTIVMERIMSKRPVPVVGLDEEYRNVHQLVEHTITAGEGNSMLLIGARGSGKTALVNKVLSEISKDNADEYHVVRLNGFIHTDDKIALREIWRQLGKEMDVEEDGGLGKNYADTLTTLLALLSHPSEHTGELTEQVAKAVIFIMDEFDLFAMHPRQTLLYNLFDIAQSRKAPIAVLGLTTRIDVTNSLEKRVKSRFSHRYVHLSLAKSFTVYQELCKASLIIQHDQLSVEERSILTSAPTSTPTKGKKLKTPTKSTAPDVLTTWNANINFLFTSKSFLTTHLAPHYYLTKSVPAALTTFLLPTAILSASTPKIAPTHTASLLPPDSKLSLLPSLPILALALLVSAARLDIIHDADTCNFNMAYDEYVSLASKAKTATALGGASSSAGITKVWGKDVARREWEELIRLGLLIPVVITGSVGDFGMCRCEVSLEECGEVVRREGLEKGVERWCRQL